MASLRQSLQSDSMVRMLPSYQLVSLISETMPGPEKRRSLVFMMLLTSGLMVMLMGRFIMETEISYSLMALTRLKYSR